MEVKFGSLLSTPGGEIRLSVVHTWVGWLRCLQKRVRFAVPFVLGWRDNNNYSSFCGVMSIVFTVVLFVALSFSMPCPLLFVSHALCCVFLYVFEVRGRWCV